MRIRSTKPEFWRSERIAAVNWDARLVLKGLESYVDDNGVGRDDIALIVSDVFPRDLVASPPVTLARVSEAISHLHKAGLVWRYEADNTPLVYVSFWESFQRIDKPGKGRFPRPDGTTEYKDSVIRESVASPPVTLAPGTGEQGSSGTGEQRNRGTVELPSAPATPKPQSKPSPSRFDEFWKYYPRKLNKADAAKAYASAIKRADEDDILAGVARMAADPNLPTDATKIPHAKTWLSGDRWNNPPYEPEQPQGRASPPRQSTAEQRAATGWNLVQQLRAEEENEYLNSVLEIGPAS